jgi:hypothetical protein
MNPETRKLALAGIFSALAAAILCLGGVIPFATYACPVLASLAGGVVDEECGKKYGWSCFAVAAVLGLLLAPDKEIALLFAFLGWYPLLKPALDRLRPGALRVFAKLLICAAAVSMMYGLMLYVLHLEEIVREVASTSPALLAVTLALGMVTFLMYDVCLLRLTYLYRRRRRKK